MTAIHTMQGVQDLLEVFGDKVQLTPKGVLGFLNKGLKGTKTIPFTSIQALQFKEAGAVFSGYIQFTIAGGNESRGGVFAAANDENTFMFAHTKNNAQAIEIKKFIEESVGKARSGWSKACLRMPPLPKSIGRKENAFVRSASMPESSASPSARSATGFGCPARRASTRAWSYNWKRCLPRRATRAVSCRWATACTSR